jgi:hypothetical protein
LERSRFIIGPTGAELRRVEEHGFSKVVGPDGVFATDLRNGLVVALQSGGSDKGEGKAADVEGKTGYVIDPDKHNGQVINYFLAAGLPKDQIGGVHATTYLSSSGSAQDARPTPPKVDGYASVVERKIEKYTVVDSVAWARMNEQGKVVSEWVYWPAISAKALADAKRIEEMLARGTDKNEFLARLPSGLPPGKIVIRHTSASMNEPFEVFASYDVLERRTSRESVIPGDRSGVTRTFTVSRHFDVAGVERRLPQERLNLGPRYRNTSPSPQTAPSDR